MDGPHEDVQFEDLIGLRGPISSLFENVFWLILFNAAFIGAFAYTPFISGEIVAGLIIQVRIFQKKKKKKVN